MMTFRLRRTIGILVFLIFSGLILYWGAEFTGRLESVSVQSGLFLVGMCFFLAAYNLRKKLPFLPLGKSSTWLQIHIYVGLLSMVMFFVHIGGRIPMGTLELTVASLYSIVALSGLIGLYLTRRIPKRLAARGGTIIYEEIPMLRRELKKQAEKIAVESIAETKKTTIADFFTYRLCSFFLMPRNQITHMLGRQNSLHKIRAAMKGVQRYLSQRELEILGQIEDLVFQKDTLDLQLALQRVLKYWLFIHIPLTYSLLIFAVFHGVIAWIYIGG